MKFHFVFSCRIFYPKAWPCLHKTGVDIIIHHFWHQEIVLVSLLHYPVKANLKRRQFVGAKKNGGIKKYLLEKIGFSLRKKVILNGAKFLIIFLKKVFLKCLDAFKQAHNKSNSGFIQ